MIKGMSESNKLNKINDKKETLEVPCIGSLFKQTDSR